MSKSKYVILGVVVSLVLLFLLWKKRDQVGVPLIGEAPKNYLTMTRPVGVNTPQMSFNSTNKSCGCNPQASQFLSGASIAIDKAQDDFASRLKQWQDNTNNFFETNSIS